MKAVILLTSADKLLNGHVTGYWLEEAAAPYKHLKDQGYEVTIASVKGGAPPLDASSLGENFLTEDARAFHEDADVQEMLKQTPAISTLDPADCDLLFCVGGHGTCSDFDHVSVADFITQVYANGKVVAAVCHGPTALVNARDISTGEPLVRGKKVTGFSNEEEIAVGLHEVVPFLLEDKLKELGGLYERSESAWGVHCVADGRLVTGQNPGSSSATIECAVKVASGISM
mmetsp:Transcript_31/g.46  ORF Transcript_31/g.46 Transcript_31/m.46 type:complete len:230 (+) Transcript_31:75-764(+)